MRKIAQGLAAGIGFLLTSLPAPAAEVPGVGNFSHVVSDLGRAVEFCGELIGLPVELFPGARLAPVRGPDNVYLVLLPQR
jgi:hypothetical protein